MFQDGPKGTISPALKCPLFTLKSKRLGANTYCSIRLGVQTGAFTSPQKSSHSPAEIHQTEMKLTCRARNTEEVHAAYSKPAYARQTPSSSPPQQSCTEDWFHSLPFQRFQALLTLFSKSFSPFPHGTCMLSVSSLYLALDENYHLLNAPIPRCANLRKQAVFKGLQVT